MNLTITSLLYGIYFVFVSFQKRPDLEFYSKHCSVSQLKEPSEHLQALSSSVSFLISLMLILNVISYTECKLSALCVFSKLKF